MIFLTIFNSAQDEEMSRKAYGNSNLSKARDEKKTYAQSDDDASDGIDQDSGDSDSVSQMKHRNNGNSRVW